MGEYKGIILGRVAVVWTVLICFIATFGCSKMEEGINQEYLINSGDRVVTVSDYNKALSVAKPAYSFEVIQDKEAFKFIKLRILNQLIEEMVLMKMANEENISVTNEELQQAVADIRADYPEEEFENTLLENVVSYATWEKRLRKRLLMQKVIKKVLEPQVTVTPEEIQTYMNTLEEAADTDSLSESETTDQETDQDALDDIKADSKDEEDTNNSEGTDTSSENGEVDKLSNENIVKELKRQKVEAIYKNWISEYKDKYQIKINDAEWKKIIGS